MRPTSKSNNSMAEQQHQQHQQTNNGHHSVNNPTSPICRCRVTYLGSSVPHITKDGLQGIQEPLRELYPDKASLASGNVGIDSWLSVWSNGILIENVDETGREVKRFFKIDALHYCAAVKYVPQPSNLSFNNNYATMNNGTSVSLPKFLPLDSPHARQTNQNPPIFASILRRTTGIKVLECHAFICKREAAANALVRCCFHAYADTMYAKQIGANVNGSTKDINNNRQQANQANHDDIHHPAEKQLISRKAKSIAGLNDVMQDGAEVWQSKGHSNSSQNGQPVARRKSINDNSPAICDTMDNVSIQEVLRRQQKLSKSMHHLNQNDQTVGMTYNQMMKEQIFNDNERFLMNQSSSASCVNLPNSRWTNQDPRMQQIYQQPFYNPYASRVPTYPPQNLMDEPNNGGTLKSIKSMAANSIASTLMRSKKHAKAMSIAQLNHDNITSFHQHHSNASTMMSNMMMPPVPPMFLPNMPRNILNGSQTMEPLGRPFVPMVGNPMNFEAMTPKEMKKLLKKGAKHGLDPSRFGDNGLPLLPMRPPQMPLHSSSSSHISNFTQDPYLNDGIDMTSVNGLPAARGLIPGPPVHTMPMKSILVKPNPEFLKSKAGKKWLKQQKEFKKLLPPHLDGLPIIFGPPPVDAMEPAEVSNNKTLQQPQFISPPVPMMDSSGFYNPHPFYGQNGRASAASTLLRYSPSHIIHDTNNGFINSPQASELLRNSHIVYNNTQGINPHEIMGHGSLVGDSTVMMRSNGYNHERHYSENELQRRNHMTEQSVISLGDENDYDDEESDQQNGYYSSNENHPSNAPQFRQTSSNFSGRSNVTDRGSEQLNYRQAETSGQAGYEQVYQTPNDDQGSYSSGIYKRGHINERAFSYSIRQEHKSGGASNSVNDYANRSEISNMSQQPIIRHDSVPQEVPMRRRNHGDGYYQDQIRPNPVNELSSRLEHQLSMKSFANSRVKSHI